MYKHEDIYEVRKQINLMIAVIAIIFAAFLIISVVVASTVNNRLGMIILIIGICLDIFVWGMYGSPILAYHSFLKDILPDGSESNRVLLKCQHKARLQG